VAKAFATEESYLAHGSADGEQLAVSALEAFWVA